MFSGPQSSVSATTTRRSDRNNRLNQYLCEQPDSLNEIELKTITRAVHLGKDLVQAIVGSSFVFVNRDCAVYRKPDQMIKPE